ncbi:hypothetical protein EDB84DRAFT_253056 [Lactarius hengduanensis]|nr:hypothetical protein EDB84DRAFT_253056 [Lactarius hengduanensis]
MTALAWHEYHAVRIFLFSICALAYSLFLLPRFQADFTLSCRLALHCSAFAMGYSSTPFPTSPLNRYSEPITIVSSQRHSSQETTIVSSL